MTPGSSDAGVGSEHVEVQRVRLRAPACRLAKYSSTVPRNANAMPTEQMITYFQVASSAVRVRRCPTRKAVTTVVASMATHITPMLLASTANTIAARNAVTSTPYCRAPRLVVWPWLELGVEVADAGPGR